MIEQTQTARQPVPVSLPWIESPFFERELAERRGSLTTEQVEQAERFRRDGYLALPGIVPPELCDLARAQCEPFFEEEWSVVNRRIQDAWTRGADSVRELATFPAVLELLEVLYGRRPVPFQTLDFKWGTEQSAHTDSMHFSCVPARFMCGIWVALEDVGPDNGPLFYYPGSHRLPEISMQDLGQPVEAENYAVYEHFQSELMQETGIQPLEYHAKKGDALIWCSNILHGGRPVHAEGSTRWSQVTHVYFEDCVYYTPFLSDVPCGELKLKSIIDLATLEPVEHRLDGRPVRIETLPNGRSRIARSSPAAGSSNATGASSASPGPAEEGGDDEGVREELETALEQIDQLRRSASYRLGHALLEPLRAVRRATSAGR